MSDGENGANGNQADPVEQLVGEGKKFKDVAALAHSKLEGDRFIEQLKAENAALRTVSQAKGNSVQPEDLEKFLAELRGERLNPTPSKVPDNNQSPQAPDLDKIVERAIEVREQKQRTEAAFASVKEQFGKQFGEMAEDAFSKSLATSGLTEELVKTLAARSPQTALKALGFEVAGKSGGLASSVDSEKFFGNTGTTRNWNHYRELRKKLGENEFYNPKIQQQLMKDRQALGDSFFNG